MFIYRIKQVKFIKRIKNFVIFKNHFMSPSLKFEIIRLLFLFWSLRDYFFIITRLNNYNIICSYQEKNYDTGTGTRGNIWIIKFLFLCLRVCLGMHLHAVYVYAFYSWLCKPMNETQGLVKRMFAQTYKPIKIPK